MTKKDLEEKWLGKLVRSKRVAAAGYTDFYIVESVRVEIDGGYSICLRNKHFNRGVGFTTLDDIELVEEQ
mgnify:CR=1 FL=1